MRDHHGLVEDRPLHRLVTGRGGQRAIVVEVEFQVGRQQTCNVKSRHQDFLAWQKKKKQNTTGVRLGNTLEGNRQACHGDHGQPGTACARVHTAAADELEAEQWV